ncbi:MAG: hypothetical protein ACK5LY_05895 [Lachnospirales bacterium]
MLLRRYDKEKLSKVDEKKEDDCQKVIKKERVPKVKDDRKT